MQENIKCISVDSSDLSWIEIDKHLKSKGFKNRSQYIQYLCEKDVHKSKFLNITIMELITLLLLAMILMMLMLVVI